MGATPILLGMFDFTSQWVVWSVSGVVLVAVIALIGLVMRRRKRSLLDDAAEIVKLIEGQESSPARDEALGLAKKLLEEVDETPTSLHLARQLRQYATAANHPDLTRRVSDAVVKLGDTESKKHRRPVRFLPLLLLLICVWLFVGPLPMYVVYYLTYAGESSARWLFPAEEANGEKKPATSMKDFFATTGTVGDTYGAINSLFTAAALAGAIYSIILQTKELSLQREEMMMTRKELSRSAEAQSRSESSLEAQAVINGLHYLAEFQRLRAANAPNELERHRARGKERAHVAKLELQLQSLGRPVFESEKSMRVSQALSAFELEVMRLRDAYLEAHDDATTPESPLGPVEDILCDVAEEAEMIHLSLPGPAAAGLALTSAVTLVSQVINRIDIQPELSAEAERQLLLGRCNDCFALLVQAIEIMKSPAAHPADAALQNFVMHGYQGLLPPAPPANQDQP